VKFGFSAFPPRLFGFDPKLGSGPIGFQLDMVALIQVFAELLLFIP
jgi:hypothetical protein